MKKYQLPKEFAEKWVSALRSGEYNQATKLLKSDHQDAYCCLGVCAVINGFTDNKKLESNGGLSEIGHYVGDYEEDFQYELLDFGIPIQLIKGDLPNDLIHLNDTEGKTFPEIADWIEANVYFI